MRQIYKLSTTTTSKTSSSSYSISKSSSSRYLSSAPGTPNLWPSPALDFGLRKTHSATNVVESQRGFKPSDTKNPHKREFLQSLTQKVFKVGSVSRRFRNKEKLN